MTTNDFSGEFDFPRGCGGSTHPPSAPTYVSPLDASRMVAQYLEDWALDMIDAPPQMLDALLVWRLLSEFIGPGNFTPDIYVPDGDGNAIRLTVSENLRVEAALAAARLVRKNGVETLISALAGEGYAEEAFQAMIPWVANVHTRKQARLMRNPLMLNNDDLNRWCFEAIQEGVIDQDTAKWLLELRHAGRPSGT